MGRRRRGLMSEQFKYELAKDLGFYDTVMREGWEGIRTKDAGNLVKRAIQIAEESLARDYNRQPQQAYQGAGQAAPPPQLRYTGTYPGPASPASIASGSRYGDYGASFAQHTQRQFPPRQPGYGYSRQNGFVPVNPAAMHPGFVPSGPAETGAAAPYLS